MRSGTAGAGLRLSELVGALSLAVDLGMGQPMEHVLRTCLLSMGLARRLALPPDLLSQVYYVALLRLAGCTSDAHETAALAGGDDIAFRSAVAVQTMGELEEIRRLVGAGSTRAIEQARTQALSAHCEVAAELGAMLGIGEEARQCLRHGFERWDGKHNPGGLRGDAIPMPVRITALARDIEIVLRTCGMEAALELARRRRGGSYDPEVADLFCREHRALERQLAATDTWTAAMDAEPQPRRTASRDSLDDTLRAFALFVDLKTPFTHGHSTGVAKLARDAARILGLPEAEAVDAGRAGLVHDLGRVGVPNGIWEKPGPLTVMEWEKVRLHPYLSERILARCPALASLAAVAGSHHERLDGSGYHRGCTAASQSAAGRVLAAADAYHAMTEPRPHRRSLTARAAKQRLTAEAEAGRLDARAVEAVLAAAGQSSPRKVRADAGLTAREVEVLRLLCQGCSNREAAAQLGITYKTVGHHVQHIYEKIGVSTRAGATLFAVSRGLLGN